MSFSISSPFSGFLLLTRLLLSLSHDNPGGWINDDEWISDDQARGKDAGLQLLQLLQDRTIIYFARETGVLLFVLKDHARIVIGLRVLISTKRSYITLYKHCVQ